MESRGHLLLRLAVDLCIFTVSGGQLRVLLVERGNASRRLPADAAGNPAAFLVYALSIGRPARP
jgi:hypothetical protein